MSNTENPGCLGFLLRMLGIGHSPANDATTDHPTGKDVFPYGIRADFLSPAERSYYGVLQTAVGQRAVICPKVGLSDIFFVTQPREHRSAHNRIAQKHVDFLLCEPETMRPLLAIELDDSSHTRADRQTRDAFVENVYKVAGLPLLRVPVQRGYHLPEVIAQIDPLIAGKQTFAEASQPAPVVQRITPDGVGSGEPPLCANCGIPMAIRMAKQGGAQGKQFYGCTNYPKCRQTIPIAEVAR